VRWAAALAEGSDPASAVRTATAALERQLDGAHAHLVLAFAAGAHARAFPRVQEQLAEQLPGALIAGCAAAGVIGAGRELEGNDALALCAAHLPDVRLASFAIAPERVPDSIAAWRALIPCSAAEPPQFVLLADPFSAPVEAVAAGLDAAFPGGVKVGGLASGAQRPGGHELCAGGVRTRAGLVGVALAGDVALDAIVAQGCRPIGTPAFVTRARDNLLLELDGRRPLDVLQELFESASPAERTLFRGSLFLGLEMRSERERYVQGDFLVRNLLGADADSGALVAGATLHAGQVVQFHLRDRATSAEDLERQLERYREGGQPVHGALLFSCVGRGRGLYGVAGHDSAAFERHLGGVPLGGFFGNGEIGPVDDRTFLHSYTSAFGLFRPRGAQSGGRA
jgi:small ligand-binding sensory domain FIST